MKFEQIEKDKIKIVLSKDDLDINKISFHSLMSNSTESQNLFLQVLDLAEKEIGFNTTNYDLAIETLVLNNSDLIFTITRLNKSGDLLLPRLVVKRKIFNPQYCYKFKNFDDFYEFFKLIKFSPEFSKSLFWFNDNFYWIPNNNNIKSYYLPEYATISGLSKNIIKEYGKQIY